MAEQPPDIVPAPPTVDPPDLTDIPPYELTSGFVQAYLFCVANEAMRLEKARQELLLSWFPATAGATLSFFERILGLAVNPPGMTTTDRQNVILAYMQAIKTQGEAAAWYAAMTAFIRGPWTYTVDYAHYNVDITVAFSAAVPVPTGLAAVPSTGGGTLPAGDWQYAVTAVTAFGETLPCAPVSATLGAPGEVALTWTANPAGPTTGYNVYRQAIPADSGVFGGGGSFGGTGTFGGTDDNTGFYLIGSTTTATALTDTGLPAGSKLAPGIDSSAAPTGQAILAFARRITPAHLGLEVTNSG